MIEAAKAYVAAQASPEGQWIFAMLFEYPALTILAGALGLWACSAAAGALARWTYEMFNGRNYGGDYDNR